MAMFDKSVELYDKIYSTKDYAAECAYLSDIIERRSPDAASLLDVACGSGGHLRHFRERFRVAGLDVNPAFMELAGRKLPDVPLHIADMRSFDLERTFDVVTCLFSAIGYLLSVRPGGPIISSSATSWGSTRSAR